MNIRLPVLLLALLMAAPVLMNPAPVQAQDRTEDTWFVKPRVGLAYYLGTNDPKLEFKFDDLYSQNWLTPAHAAVEVGYRFSQNYSLSATFAYSNYGNINDFNQDDKDSPSLGYFPQRPGTSYPAYESGSVGQLQWQARKHFGMGKWRPFIQLGAAYQYHDSERRDGSGSKREIGWGPQSAIGIDRMIGERTYFGFETGGAWMFDGNASDGAGEKWAPDWLGWNAVSLTYDLKAFVPVMITDIVCPQDEVEINTPVTFTGSTNMDATPIVNYSWSFGDGSTAEGMTATHAYSQAGTYTVQFNASNGNGRAMDSRTCTVTAFEPIPMPAITSITASPSGTVDTETSVRFNASTSDADTFRWDFGDGTTSTDRNPTHTYREPGTYTVTLEVCNETGCATRTTTVVVTQYEAPICAELEEMASVYFDRNSSTLTEQGRAALAENVEILQVCPNMNVRVEGLAAPGERRAQELSEARARAVEQFYIDNGIAASRIMTAGMGRADARGSKKDGLSMFRRADTIPVR